ncbi:hypothetical protein B1B_01962, partial [mine drainage metagenome]
TVFEILNEAEIRPHKIRYYVEKRDPDFEEKMTTVLHAILLQNHLNPQRIVE